VDKQAIIKNVLNTLAVSIPGPFFPEMRGYDSRLKGYPFDPARAKTLLKEAGVEAGFDATLDTSAPFKTVSEALAGQLNAVGVRVNVNVMEAGVLTAKINQGQSDIYYNTWGDSTADGGTTLYRHFSSAQRKTFIDTGYSRPDLDKLIEEGNALMDLNNRQALFAQAGRIVVNDAPWIFLWQPKSLAATAAGVRGFVARPDAYLFLDKVTKS
jgi:peptide/nickel transport system substrate-binding protein